MSRKPTVVSVSRSFSSKAHRRIFQAAVAAGWKWRHNGAHVILIPPPPAHLVSLSTSATEGGNVNASLAQARRSGLDV